MEEKLKFRLRVVNAKETVYEGDVSSVQISGDQSEYELLAFHYPLMSNVKEGKVIIDSNKFLKISKGLLKFSENDCLILID